MRNRESIDSALARGDLKFSEKKKLESVVGVLEFAEEELHLPAQNQYRNYVHLDRKYVVWAVGAAPEFSLEPITWWYPRARAESMDSRFRINSS